MKRKVNIAVLSLLMVIFITQSVFAMPYNPNQYTSVNEPSELLAAGVKQSKVTEYARARGEFFASADLTVKNNGDGKVGALAVALFRHPVDEVYITIYLDRWDAEAERWRQVNYYEAEFYAADFPDGLTTPYVDISFVNQPKGYYYRLRGVFGALYNGGYEGFSPVTDGILLD
uniref:DUF6147 family protein n=1 Tax=Enterocloster hominis (ex Hitch et al. 2024) TaxID=1917870 RepID=UPI0010325405|nr:DUF6147 family protein [Lachnoclostridium pacaense]